ncbi:MAG: Tex family protein [bacterium]
MVSRIADSTAAQNPGDATVGFITRVSTELGIASQKIAATARLLADGATVPFIARYRKEVTGSLDEVQIAAVRDRMQQLAELEKRREAIVGSLSDRNLLTAELAAKVLAADTMTTLEDVFAPYRPKRRTRATAARERGLEPLADWLIATPSGDPSVQAAAFVVESEDKDKAVPTADDALAGARDIIAERVSDDATARQMIRSLFEKDATVKSRVASGKSKDQEAQKYRDYFEWSEPLATIPSHRLLAIRRGENEGFLMMRVEAPEEKAIADLKKLFVKGAGAAALQVGMAVEDGYRRLLSLSVETDMRVTSKHKADAEAIRVFVENIRELLMSAPLGQKRVLAVDPGFRTGCKLAVLDAQGKLLFDLVLHTTGDEDTLSKARTNILKIVDHFKIEAIAIGNGTAGRETEALVRRCKLPKSVIVVVVNESGASIYSASPVAREEFPDKDITVRGAVSIGRRLMDPLAELVKIDPKSIGVGQYQHDVDQNALKQALDDTVMSCVNRVGVEVNTSSKQLLRYVSGLNATLAENIVSHRNQNGPFTSREALRKVPRMGDKTFEQAAGFLRIRGGLHPLDSSAVHPERYQLVEQMASDVGCTVTDLMRDDARRAQIKLDKYTTDSVGLPTLKDIMEELAKPGRDPRERFEAFSFTEGVEKVSDLKQGMKLPGIVTNVTAFGAFVDIGVHQDGLVHISQLADQFVTDPGTFVKVGQHVQVTVTDVDLERNRIALSMKAKPEMGPRQTGAGQTGPAPRRTAPAGRERPAGRTPVQPLSGGWFDIAIKKGN